VNSTATKGRRRRWRRPPNQLEILGDRLEFLEGGPTLGAGRFQGLLDAVRDVVVDESLLRIHDRILDRLHLLGEIETGVSFLDHRDDSPKVSFGAPQPLGDLGVIMMVRHMNLLSCWAIVSPR
jgi:hypothetical protein